MADQMKVFVSHSGDEKELATSFADWLEKDLSDSF